MSQRETESKTERQRGREKLMKEYEKKRDSVGQRKRE